MAAREAQPGLPLSFTRAIDRLDEIVDPVLVRALARVEQPMIPLDPKLPQSWRPVKTYLEDPAAWYAGYLRVKGEIEPPWELRRDLKERVPQALLRDMLRPAYPDRPVRWERRESGVDHGGRQALKEAREALLRAPAPEIEAGTVVVAREQARRRAFLLQPWAATLPDDAPRKYYDEMAAMRGSMGWE